MGFGAKRKKLATFAANADVQAMSSDDVIAFAKTFCLRLRQKADGAYGNIHIYKINNITA